MTQKQAAQLADLPEEMSLALADIAAVAREGLLAMSVAAGMAVMQTMFEAEVTGAPHRGAARQREGLGDPGRSSGRGDPATSPHPGRA